MWYVGTLALIVISFSAALYVKLEKSHEKNIESSLEAIAQGLKNDISEAPHKMLQDILDKEKEREVPLNPVYIQVLKIGSKPAGEVAAKSNLLKGKTLPLFKTKRLAENVPLFKTISDKSIYPFPLKVIGLPVSIGTNKQYLIEAASPLRKEDDALDDLVEALFVLDPVLLIVALLGGYFLIQKTLTPVRNIVLSAKKITAEDLSHRIEAVDTKDEIGELVETFNDMISRLEKSFIQIKQFSSDVAHELKTPITAIRGMSEVILRKERPKKEYIDAFKNIVEETINMQVIIDNLLFLSRTEAQDVRYSFKTIALDEVLLEVFESMEILAKEKKVRLILSRLQQVSIKGDRNLIKRLFSNLIDNAVKYTHKGGKVEVFLERNDNFARFSVKDTGIGISKDELPYIFNRFYKADETRHRDGGGSGLGLSIVQRIAQLHKGRIDVESIPDKGSTFAVFLPIQD